MSLTGAVTYPNHLEEEEREVFQVAGKVLDDQDKSKLAESYRSEMEARQD